jgi:hypothetical protein
MCKVAEIRSGIVQEDSRKENSTYRLLRERNT